MTENNKERLTARWTLVIIAVILSMVVIMHFQHTAEENALRQQIAELRQYNNIEAEILVNQMAERIELYGKDMNMGDYLARHNYYLEQYYNTLLKYDDKELTAEIMDLEICLTNLYAFKLAYDRNAQNEVGKRCNAIGEKIDELLFLQLVEKTK